MIIDQLPNLASVQTTDEIPIERGTTTYKATLDKIAPVRSVNGETGDVNIPEPSPLAAYPVGSIYMSVNSTSPATLFGGTWERIQDYFLLAAGPNHAAGSTGGEETHQLTVDEMPSHSHNIYGGNNADPPDWFGGSAAAYGIMNRVGTPYGYLSNTGGGSSHNNMPPYLTVYMWKRTA